MCCYLTLVELKVLLADTGGTDGLLLADTGRTDGLLLPDSGGTDCVVS